MRVERPIPANALAKIRAPFLEADAAPTDAPVLQPLALLLDLAGEAMRSRVFAVQGERGEEAALRPDFTIPIARAHIDSGAASGRYLYEGKAFRVAPAGTGRAEEFLQIGLEAYGGDDPARDDAEVAALAWRAATAGGRDDLTLQLATATPAASPPCSPACPRPKRSACWRSCGRWPASIRSAAAPPPTSPTGWWSGRRSPRAPG